MMLMISFGAGGKFELLRGFCGRADMFARKQKFENVTIFLDGSSFIECTFENCNLIYSGLLPAALNTNSFNNCRWEFSGAAQNTVGFMADLYRAGAQELIEATFDNIRGKPNPAAVITKY